MGKRGVPALLFHRVGPSRPGTYPSLTVQPRRFEHFMGLLRDRGYTGVSARAWSAWRRGVATMPKRPILLTFDDGYADLGDYALPLLDRLGWGATVFIATSTVGGRSAWDEPEGAANPILTAAEVRRWSARGVEFGAHGMTHSDLTLVDRETLLGEVLGSRDALAELLGRPVTSFAYPYGRYDDKVREVVGSSFEVAFSTEEGLNDGETDRTRLRRTMVQATDTAIDLVLRARLGWSPFERVRARIRLRNRGRRLGRLRVTRAARRISVRSSSPSRPR
jgi:peptidoglycan/xylan/chitin deacetylase (PgdA/CDA1 family)